jgi:hypothetical protein
MAKARIHTTVTSTIVPKILTPLRAHGTIGHAEGTRHATSENQWRTGFAVAGELSRPKLEEITTVCVVLAWSCVRAAR